MPSPVASGSVPPLLIVTPHVRTLSSAGDVMLNRPRTGGRAVGVLMERFDVPVGAAFSRTTLTWKLGRWWHLPSFQYWSE